MSPAVLAALVVFAVALLLTLILALRLHAFVALLLTSLVVALVGGVEPAEIAGEIQQAMGATLGYIAVVIGLGAMLGEMLRRSGGAGRIASALLAACGERAAPWALALAGLVVAVPVFFDVALVVLIPLVYDLARRSGRSLLFYAVPLLAGIAVGHSFIPPTPGPVAVAGLLGADLGWVILIGLAAGLPATAVGGVWFGRRMASAIHLGIPEAGGTAAETAAETVQIEAVSETGGTSRRVPGLGTAAGLVALPLALMLLGTVSAVALPGGGTVRQVLAFVGHPFTALLATVLVAFWALGTRLGFSAAEVREMAGRSLEPVGMIVLVTGAGGVFGKALLATGVGQAAAAWLEGASLPLALLAFAIAAAVRVVQGSATVSMVTAGGLIAPLVEVGDYSAPQIASLVVAIACGATVLSHVNDSGFWLVGRFLGMSERQTLRVWTVMETLVGVTGLAVALAVFVLA